MAMAVPHCRVVSLEVRELKNKTPERTGEKGAQRSRPTVRWHGGNLTLPGSPPQKKVDPAHMVIARNMVAYAGMAHMIDIWTGHSYLTLQFFFW